MTIEMVSHVIQYVYIPLNGERSFYAAVQFLLEDGFRTPLQCKVADEYSNIYFPFML